MTSIRDVAQQAGVSVATVSRALRGLPRVSEETRRRVQEVAASLDYVASPSAASLASGVTRTVGVVVPHVSRWFFGSVVQGMQPVFAEAGYDLLLWDLEGRRDAWGRVFGHLLSKRVDAVLVLSIALSPQEEAALRRLGKPVVVVGGQSEFPGVRIDDHGAAVTAVRHLVGLGHRRIAFVGVERGEEGLHTTPRDRLAGYRWALEEAGLERSEALELTGDYTVDSGIAAAARVVADQGATAVFAASDEMAMGVLHGLRCSGRAVPEQVSVVGVDDHPMAVLFDLTTVAQPAAGQGRVAAEVALDLLHGEDVPPADVVLPTRLVVRGTSGPPPPGAAAGSPAPASRTAAERARRAGAARPVLAARTGPSGRRD
ncbi:LacI family DNA-binding transcriptional regulator [Vallicoccus soli]|uniref:LacI family transcriptional regulator n=1 Tax=Vallicoccus soli TaxID=2339232 RepID=A0A3A3YP39_9ACTN|nr:LacI family DNA-binding transcriptional regulator [Vallicoccus soli]RJK92950.1 LacI family transcriptional regulator [Vallicoccus soli]